MSDTRNDPTLQIPEEKAAGADATRVVNAAGSEATLAVKSAGTDATLFQAPAASPPDEQAAEEKEWRSGDVILDIYEVKDVFESGGFGKVYRVHHRSWNMDLAMKSLRSKFLRNREMKEAFTLECQGWVNLGLHPHITSCYYVRDIEGLPRIFAEFMEGGSLEQRLSEGQQEDLPAVLDLALQCLDGLSFAHGKGLIHRDIKPDNCLLTSEGILKITDFGIASGLSTLGSSFSRSPIASEGTMILEGGAVGTPAYMPPEQWNPALGAHGPWTDLYAFGVMLFELCTGERPFDEGGEDPAVLQARHLTSEPPDPRELRSDIPGALSEFIRKCLQKRPESRYQSCSEAREALTKVYEECAGKPYPRTEPEEIELRADSLNNRAASLLDLGKSEEALSVWKEALGVEPHHIESTYNRSLMLWRQGKITDMDAVSTLEEMRKTYEGDWLDEYLLCQIHLERRDRESALAVLDKMKPGDARLEPVIELRKQAETQSPHWHCIRACESDHAREAAFSGDGTVALTGEQDAFSTKLWEVETGAVTHLSHGRAIWCFCLGSSGATAALGCKDGTLLLWNTRENTPLKSSAGHNGLIKTIDISGDDRFVLTGSMDGTLKLWEAGTGQCVRTYEGHQKTVTCAALSADGSLALSGSEDGTLRLWKAETGTCVHTYQMEKNPVKKVTLSSDASVALLMDEFGYLLRIMEVKSGRFLHTFDRHESKILSATLSRNGRLLFTGSQDGRLRLQEVATGKVLRTFQGEHFANAVAMSADGRRALSVNNYKTVKCWSLESSSELKGLYGAPFSLSRVKSVDTADQLQRQFRDLLQQAQAASASGCTSDVLALIERARALPGFSRDRKALDLWNLAGAQAQKKRLRDAWCVHRIEGYSKAVSSVAFCPGGDTMLSASYDNSIDLWDLSTAKKIHTFTGHTHMVLSIALSPDGRWLASGSLDKTLRLWEVSTGKCHHVVTISTRDKVDSLAIYPDIPGGSLRRFADTHGTIFTMPAGSNRKAFYVLAGHAVAIAPDGQRSFSGSNELRMFEAPEHKFSRCFVASTNQPPWVSCLSLSADGLSLLAGYSNSTLRLWEVPSGTLLKMPVGHTGSISSVALSADGRWAVSGGVDTHIRLWELSTGRCLRVFEGHTSEVKSVALSPDCRWILSGGNDCTLRLWELDWELSPESM